MSDFKMMAVNAAAYDSLDAAEQDYEAVKVLYYGLGLMDTFYAAVVTKDDKGKVKIVKKHEQPTRQGGWLGEGLLATGLLDALFPGVALGIGALAGYAAGGMSRADLKDLGDTLGPGQTCLVVIAETDVGDRVFGAMIRAKKVIQKQIKADRKELEKEIEAGDLKEIKAKVDKAKVDLNVSGDYSDFPLPAPPHVICSTALEVLGTGGQPAEGRPPGGDKVKTKRINAWIAEREADKEKPLIVRQSYTLKLNVGDPHAGSLINTDNSNLPLSEIPDEGLETTWVVTSDSVGLAVATSNDVKVEATDSPASWAATFALRIPKSGESTTRQLRVTPMIAQGAEVGIVIFARNTLYRQFRVELKVEEVRPPDTTDEPSARVAGDVVCTPLRYTGLRPPHEWLTPRGTLNITVTGSGKATVSGDGWNVDEQRLSVVIGHADWNLPLPILAGRIKNVHDSAEKFRAKFSAELNDIDRHDLQARLSSFKNNTGTFWANNRADPAHTQVWEQTIAGSQELYDLAYYGYELYKTFFPDKTKLRQWLDALKPDWRVNLSWSKYIDPNWVAHVPWSLLYTRPLTLGQPVDAMYFWGLRYRFNYLAHESDSGLSPALGGLTTTSSAYGFYWGDDDQEIVEEVMWQQAEWAKWGNQMFVPDNKIADTPKQQLLALFNKPPHKPTPVLYFFCQCDVGDGNKPVLRFGKTKNAADNIKLTDLSQTPFESGPLVFINACTSAASDPYIANELEQTFFERGCRSYIGTEVKVPIRFATRFAEIFYSFFFRDLAPEPVAAGEAVFQTRRFLWREYRSIGGLIYAYINIYELYMATESEVDALHDHN